MKRYFLFTIMSVLLISCQQSLTPDQSDLAVPKNEVMTKSLSTGKVGPDDPVVFLPATNMKAWTGIESLENRFAMCDVPISRLKAMTTEALVKSIMNYPLNYLIFVYNDPETAIDIIVDKSPLHQELLSRLDVKNVFINLYATADLDMRIEKSDFDSDYTSLSYTNTMFMDYFLGYKVLPILGESSVKQQLTEAVIKKLDERVQNKETFSTFSIEPLLVIDETASLGIMSSNRYSPFNILTISNVKTVFGKDIEACIVAEMSADEMEQIIDDCVTQYPNAILRGSATRDYNSHSYAWYSQSLENNYWINYITQSGIYQLSKYWTSDLYESCSESEAEKIYYSDGDHSAIKLSNGNYLSKWGQGPLMEHSPTYCPYIQTNMEYYRIRTSPIPGSISVNGPTSVEVNQSNYYSVQNYNSNFTYTWEVRFMDAPSPTPFVLNANNSTCTLICQDYGYFKTSIYGYYQGRCVAHGQIGVIAMP